MSHRRTLTTTLKLSYQGSLHWCIPRNHDDTRYRIETFYCICKHFCGCTYESLCMHSSLSPGVAILRNSGSRREMTSHVHTGTLRYLHTAITIQNLTDWNIMFNTQPCVTTGNTKTGRESGTYIGCGCVVTRACTAIYTFFLADLLDVETMAGCGAGLGAFIVLHSNWALRDYISKKHIFR